MPGPTPQLYDVDLMNAEQERDFSMLKHLLLPGIQSHDRICKLVTDIFLWLQFTQQGGIELTPTTSQ
jgi:hypothetical protein